MKKALVLLMLLFAVPVYGLEIGPKPLTGRAPEIIKTTSATLTLTEVSGTLITNYGETDDADLILTLPDLDGFPGARFVYEIVTAMSTNDTCLKAASDNAFVLDGVAGADNGCICNTAPTILDTVICRSVTNGSGTVKVRCDSDTGAWAIVADNTGDCPD